MCHIAEVPVSPRYNLEQRLLAVFACIFTRCQIEFVVITCPDPGGISNGERSPASGPFMCGTEVSHTCHTGFLLRGVRIIKCDTNGNFVPPAQPHCDPGSFLLPPNLSPLTETLLAVLQLVCLFSFFLSSVWPSTGNSKCTNARSTVPLCCRIPGHICLQRLSHWRRGGNLSDHWRCTTLWRYHSMTYCLCIWMWPRISQDPMIQKWQL